MATSALATGPGVCMDNEHEYNQRALKILDTVLSEEEGGYEIATTEK